MRVVMRATIAIVLVGAWMGMARAEIYVWQDSEGVRHYTNVREEIPAEATDTLRVLVQEPPHAEPEAEAKVATPETPEPSPPRQAQVVYNRTALDAAYAEGWQEGMERAAQLRAAAPPVSVEVNGPFVAAVGGATAFSASAYPVAPLVTTSFDRGRSRHLTLRMALQDQFALDRDGPVLFEERFFAPPAGPRSCLSRGLSNARAPCRRVVRR